MAAPVSSVCPPLGALFDALGVEGEWGTVGQNPPTAPPGLGEVVEELGRYCGDGAPAVVRGAVGVLGALGGRFGGCVGEEVGGVCAGLLEHVGPHSDVICDVLHVSHSLCSICPELSYLSSICSQYVLNMFPISPQPILNVFTICPIISILNRSSIWFSICS